MGTKDLLTFSPEAIFFLELRPGQGETRTCRAKSKQQMLDTVVNRKDMLVTQFTVEEQFYIIFFLFFFFKAEVLWTLGF